MKQLILLYLFISTMVFANVASVTALRGEVSALREGETIQLVLNSLLEEKDIVNTGNNGRAQLIFKDQTIISIGKNSSFNIQEYIFDIEKPKESKANFSVNKGIFKTITGQIGKINPSKFKLKTKSASIGIRGTIFFVDLKPGESETYSCTEGEIVIETPDGTQVTIPAGYKVKVEYGKPPSELIPLSQEDKEKLEENSGAKENEKESGKDQKSVNNEKDKKEEEKKKKEQEDKNKKEDDKKQNDSNDNNNDDNTPDQKNNDDLDTEDDTDTEVDTDSADEASDTANDSATEAANDEKKNTVEESDDTETKKTVTYDLVPMGTYAPKSSAGLGFIDTNSYYEKLNSNKTITITDGVINGSYTLYAYHFPSSTEEAYDGNDTGNEQDTLTINFNNMDIGAYKTSYTGYSKINTTPITSISGATSEFYGDSMHEFFLHRTKKEETNYEYDLNVVFGQKSTSSDIATKGISYYKDISSNDSTNYEPSTDGSYINWTNKNLLSYHLDDDNGLFIVMGEVKTTNGKEKLNLNFYRRSTDFTNHLNEVSGTSDMYIYGSEYQGWGGSITVKDENGARINYVHGQFRDANFSSEGKSTPTYETDYKGFINSDANSALGDTLNLELDRDSKITAEFNIGGTSGYNEISITGSLGSEAAYITDDTFAVINTDQEGAIQYDGNNVDGWLIAIDSGDVADDDISWGFWGSDLSNVTLGSTVTTNKKEYASAWIVAKESEIVSNISSLSSLGVASYSGKIMGILDNGGIRTFIDPSKSTLTLSFDFGANQASASLSANNGEFTHSMTNITTSLNDNTSSTYTINDSGDQYKGSFIKNGDKTIGSFNVTADSTTATGVYNLKK